MMRELRQPIHLPRGSEIRCGGRAGSGVINHVPFEKKIGRGSRSCFGGPGRGGEGLKRGGWGSSVGKKFLRR